VRGELRGTGVEISCVMPGLVRTELTSGLDEPWYVKAVDPEAVGEAIVAALRRPRFDVFVPRSLGAQFALGAITPRPLREALARRLGGDRLFFEYNPAQRAAYERRAREAATQETGATR